MSIWVMIIAVLTSCTPMMTTARLNSRQRYVSTANHHRFRAAEMQLGNRTAPQSSPVTITRPNPSLAPALTDPKSSSIKKLLKTSSSSVQMQGSPQFTAAYVPITLPAPLAALRPPRASAHPPPNPRPQPPPTPLPTILLWPPPRPMPSPSSPSPPLAALRSRPLRSSPSPIAPLPPVPQPPNSPPPLPLPPPPPSVPLIPMPPILSPSPFPKLPLSSRTPRSTIPRPPLKPPRLPLPPPSPRPSKPPTRPNLRIVSSKPPRLPPRRQSFLTRPPPLPLSSPSNPAPVLLPPSTPLPPSPNRPTSPFTPSLPMSPFPMPPPPPWCPPPSFPSSPQPPAPPPPSPWPPLPPPPSRMPSQAKPPSPRIPSPRAPRPLSLLPFKSIPAGNCSDTRDTLSRSNAYRALHGAPPLVWDENLAATSQSWAASLAGSGCAVNHDYRVRVGENIAAMVGYPPPDNSCADVTRAWYDEVGMYNFSAALPFTENRVNNIGHFTQLVWVGSSRVGCGSVVIPTRVTFPGGYSTLGGCKVVVCRYMPPGNIADDESFRVNVLPAVQSAPPSLGM